MNGVKLSYPRLVTDPFVPVEFEVPITFEGTRFRLEPLGPVHNERDHRAWMSSIDHIRSTPGMGGQSWPAPMSLDENLADMEMHAREFADRSAFAYSILDAGDVIGCVYIDPAKVPRYASVSSWVVADRPQMDVVVWRDLSAWLARDWPFEGIEYAERR
ncbi:hypothetical protein BH23ACT4_BH23ACT4_11190 [soil metagenome]